MLEQLLGMDVSTFKATWWRRRFCLLPGRALPLLGGLPNPAQVRALLGPAVDEAGAVRFLSYPGPEGPITRTWFAARPGAPRRDEAEPINLPQAELHLPSLRGLEGAIFDYFGAPANLQLFLAGPGAEIAPHRDLNDSVVIQLHGRKRWRYLDPELWPPAGNMGGALPDDAPEVVLAPSDVLYKPSGAVHATQALDEDTLSLTASVSTTTMGEVLLRSLRLAMAGDPTWSLRWPHGPEDAEALRADLSAALERLRERPSATELAGD